MSDPSTCDHLLGYNPVADHDHNVALLTVSNREKEIALMRGVQYYCGSPVAHLSNDDLIRMAYEGTLFTFCPRCGVRNTGPGFDTLIGAILRATIDAELNRGKEEKT